MNKKTTGLVLLVVGVLLLIASLTVDLFWSGGFAGFGYKQTLGTAIGVIMAAAGFILRSKA